MLNRVIFTILSSLSLIACSAPGVKPEDANLLEAAVNISSGEFDTQLSREQFKLNESQATLNKEADKNQRLTGQLQTLEIEKKALDNQLTTLQQENALLVQQTNETKAATVAQQNQREQQLRKIRAINSSVSKLKNGNVSPEGNDEYKEKISSLEQEITVLRQMISNQ